MKLLNGCVIIFLHCCYSIQTKGSVLNSTETTPNICSRTDAYDLQQEQSFIKDLLLQESSKNYILVDLALNTPCGNVTCEKYSLPGLKEALSSSKLRLNAVHARNIYDAHVVVLKLSVYACAEQILNPTRKFIVKSPILILIGDDYTFQRMEEHIVKNNIYNIYLVRKTGQLYRVYETCAFCNAGITQIRPYNTWKPTYGFSKQMKYESSFKGEFFGKELSIGVQPRPPSIFPIGRNATGAPMYSGTDYLLLEVLAKFLHFNIVIKKPRDGLTCWSRKSGLAGFCKMLLEKEVDIAGFPMQISSFYYPFMDYTAIYYQVGNVIISANPPLQTKWNFFVLRVDPVLFILIITSYLVSIVSMWLITKYWYYEHDTLFDLFFQFFAIFCLEATRSIEKKLYQQVILALWMIVSFLVVALIFGEITSIAASPVVSRKPIDSIADMVNNDMSWISEPIYRVDGYLKSNKHTKHLQKKSKYMNIPAGLQYLQDNPHEYVYYFPREGVDPMIRLKFWNGVGRNPFHISPLVDGDYRLPLTALVRKDAPYRDALARKLLQVEAAGLYRLKMMPDVMDFFGKTNKGNTVKEEEIFTPFRIGNILGTLLLWGFGLTISTLVWLIECIITKMINSTIKRTIQNVLI